MSDEYKKRHQGADRFFKAITRILGDAQLTCDAEALAQILAAKNRVYR